MPIVGSPNNRKITSSIVAIARAQTLTLGFDRARALEIAARLEAAIAQERTAESTYALCALVVKGMGITDARELADMLGG